MLSRVDIENYKCIRKAQITLEPFTLFIGANGSGKSSVLEAIDLTLAAIKNSEVAPKRWARNGPRIVRLLEGAWLSPGCSARARLARQRGSAQ